MKTSFDISEPLLREVQRVAKERGTTTRSLVEEALVRLLDQVAVESDRPFVLRDVSVRGQGLSPEFVNSTWEEIRDASYGVRSSS